MYTNVTTKAVVEKYISLPGGVTLTLRPTESTTALKTKASLRNMHGDTIVTLNGNGVNETGILLYEPYGAQVVPTIGFASANLSVSFAASVNTPDNQRGSQSLAWAGSVRRSNESLLVSVPIQMGSRVYIPGTGRFISTDPVPGGNANSYVFAVDPINSNDYSGLFSITGALNSVKSWVVRNKNDIVGSVLTVSGTITMGVAPFSGVFAPLIVAAGAAQYGLAVQNFAQARGMSDSQASQYAWTTFLGMSGSSYLQAPATQLQSPRIPQSALDTWDKIGQNGYQSLGPGWKVAPFKNHGGKLPTDTTYTEYYLNPRPIQGSDRIVQGANGNVYYTPDHYETFRRLQ